MTEHEQIIQDNALFFEGSWKPIPYFEYFTYCRVISHFPVPQLCESRRWTLDRGPGFPASCGKTRPGGGQPRLHPTPARLPATPEPLLSHLYMRTVPQPCRPWALRTVLMAPGSMMRAAGREWRTCWKRAEDKNKHCLGSGNKPTHRSFP